MERRGEEKTKIRKRRKCQQRVPEVLEFFEREGFDLAIRPDIGLRDDEKGE